MARVALDGRDMNRCGSTGRVETRLTTSGIRRWSFRLVVFGNG